MKKNALRVIALVLVAGMLFAFASCTQEIHVRFVDKDGNDIILSSEKEFLIESGEVDEYGNVIKEKEPKEMLMLVLTYSDMQKIFSDEVRVVLDYKLENEKHKNVFLKSTDWLDLKIMFHIDGSVILNPTEMN